MIGIEYRINGRRVDPSQVESRIEAALLRKLDREVQRKLDHVWCPRHQQWPRVIASGPSADQLKLQVGGCCQDLKDRATTALA
jgi:hypothetical protein